MAKALYGHIGGPDPRLLTELATLRRRVADQEAELTRLRAENRALTAAAIAAVPDVGSEELLAIDVTSAQPALA